MDMARLKAALLQAGYKVVVDARIILVVRAPATPGPTPSGASESGTPVESSLYDNGRVLLKTTDRAAAELAYAALEPHLAAAIRA